MSKRGYFGIGIYNGKFASNLGTLWRSAYQLGADYVYTIGDRYSNQRSDTVKALNHIPMFSYKDFDEFERHLPDGAQVVAIETSCRRLSNFVHPKQCVYLLGAEDSGLPEEILQRCSISVSIEAVNSISYNVAVAGSLVMYDRFQKMAPRVGVA